MGENPAEQFPYPEKLDLLRKAVVELVMVHQAGRKEFRSEAALEFHKGKSGFTFSSCYAELIQIGGAEKILSSLEAGGPLMRNAALLYIQEHDVLDPKFEFSEDIERFEEELVCLLVLFYSSVKEIIDPATGRGAYPEFSREDNGKFDLAIMKALFQAGKIIERLNQEGKARSDAQAEHGAKPSQKHIGYQAVHDAFYRVDLKGLKSLVEIGAKIKEHLQGIEDEKRVSKKKSVYCADYIGKYILPKDPNIKEILLREGILKS